MVQGADDRVVLKAGDEHAAPRLHDGAYRNIERVGSIHGEHHVLRVRDLEQPLLVITAENAWSRSGAEAMYENAPGEKVFSLIPDAGHFDVYDLEPYVTEATEELVAFFEEQL